ncbi:MAG: BrnT family toxin [Anaerolineae bacterium]|nr:BrnT family toxin [Anaerolineae bacterium]
MVDLSKVDGFEWDDSNRAKNWEKHQVATAECEEVFFNLPLLLAHDTRHSQDEKQFYGLGQTNAGRHLFIAFTMRTDKIRVISARDMNDKERQAYAKTNPSI